MKELRLAGVSGMEAGNAFLSGFMARFNERFAVPPARQQDLHRKLNVTPDRLDDVLCHRELRYVTEQLTLSYDRKQIILERNDITERLAGKYVELYDFFDRLMQVRWKGLALPFRVFNKEQRVTHTAIVENKRLGHALSIVKAQQDMRLEAKVLTNSEKTGYQKRPRRKYGPDFLGNAPAAVEMWKSPNNSDSAHPPQHDDQPCLTLTFSIRCARETFLSGANNSCKNKSQAVRVQLGFGVFTATRPCFWLLTGFRVNWHASHIENTTHFA